MLFGLALITIPTILLYFLSMFVLRKYLPDAKMVRNLVSLAILAVYVIFGLSTLRAYSPVLQVEYRKDKYIPTTQTIVPSPDLIEKVDRRGQFDERIKDAPE